MGYRYKVGKLYSKSFSSKKKARKAAKGRPIVKS